MKCPEKRSKYGIILFLEISRKCHLIYNYRKQINGCPRIGHWEIIEGGIKMDHKESFGVIDMFIIFMVITFSGYTLHILYIYN